MDKETRNTIQRATQAGRQLLESDYQEQLEAIYDILPTGEIADAPGTHLTDAQVVIREKLVAAISHKQAMGMQLDAAVAAYIRDAAFTTLNRFVALKMLEAREIVKECVSNGESSTGAREFIALCPALSESADMGYRLFIESVFDEVGQDIKVLFDRQTQDSLLWPTREAVRRLLEILNDLELQHVWSIDETVGWLYQYFHSDIDRKAARYTEKGKPKAPSSSNELAVRNQFFTPKYVVRFLSDNTLGRLWCEMMGGNTKLSQSPYFVPQSTDGRSGPARKRKDPRDIKVLDPACGSGHFLLYAFELLLAIYEEAWDADASPQSEVTQRTLREDYPDRESLRAALPALILSHNLFGIDIDRRCAQIASLALWMRAHRAFNELSVAPARRQPIRKTNIVVAEPMSGDEELVKSYLDSLPSSLRDLVGQVIARMEVAGKTGSLLRIEAHIRSVIRGNKHGELFKELDKKRWALIEDEVMRSLSAYARGAFHRKLFAEDAAQGLGFIAVSMNRYDVVLMNPPFGDPTPDTIPLLKSQSTVADLYCGFVHRAVELCPNGWIGAITNSSFLLYTDFADFRLFLRDDCYVSVLADLGWGVLDASVGTAMYVLSAQARPTAETLFLGVAGEPESLLLSGVSQIAKGDLPQIGHRHVLAKFGAVDGSPFAYGFASEFFDWVASAGKLAEYWAEHGIGAGPHKFFFRLRWELPQDASSAEWPMLANGGHYSPFFRDNQLHIDWEDGGRKIKAHLNHVYPYLKGNIGLKIQREAVYGRAGLTYGKRTGRFNAQVLPPGIPSFEGIGAYPKDAESRWWILAYMNSRFVAFFLNMTCGQHKNAVYVDRVPVPEFTSEQKRELSEAAKQLFELQKRANAIKETSSTFVQPALAQSEGPLLRRMITWRKSDRSLELKMWDALSRIECNVRATVPTSNSILKAIADDQGRDVTTGGAPPSSPAPPPPRTTSGPSRPVLARGETTDTDLFRAASVWGADVVQSASRLDEAEYFDPEEFELRTAELISWVFGQCMGRFECGDQESLRTLRVAPVWTDDQGHPGDISSAIETRLQLLHAGVDAAAEASQVLGVDSLREWVRTRFFDFHIKTYSRFRRKAPIYWQLATKSGGYSVWVYAHGLENDTLFNVVLDLVSPKLELEERRLASMIETSDPDVSKQTVFVEELRVFREELTRVAELWTPTLRDGVITNCAALWRLFPQCAPWQGTCFSAWEKMIAGDRDWALLSMRYWPERIVPMCAKNHSLAIAHSLEDVFWQVDDGKWKPRKVDDKKVAELIAERTSPAVKAALKSLLDAPAPAKKKRKKRSKR